MERAGAASIKTSMDVGWSRRDSNNNTRRGRRFHPDRLDRGLHQAPVDRPKRWVSGGKNRDCLL